MSAKSNTHEPLIFAWHARDYSLWHLIAALLLLMATMAGFFFIFRIVHPVAQRLPATPHHVISLDPNNPAALAIIHRAQDRSFALLADGDPTQTLDRSMLAFHPSFENYQLKLRETPPAVASTRVPHLFTPGMDVLPPVPRRDIAPPVADAPVAKLHAIPSDALAKRSARRIELPAIALTQPTRVQFRVAVGSAGQVVTALPLCVPEDVAVMNQLHAAVCALRFEPSPTKRMEWGEISFRWEEGDAP